MSQGEEVSHTAYWETSSHKRRKSLSLFPPKKSFHGSDMSFSNAMDHDNRRSYQQAGIMTSETGMT